MHKICKNNTGSILDINVSTYWRDIINKLLIKIQKF